MKKISSRTTEKPVAPTPFAEMGVPGTAVQMGYVVEGEKDPRLTGSAKYREYGDLVANLAIVATGVRFFLQMIGKSGWRIEPADQSAQATKLAELTKDILHSMRTPWHRVVKRAAMYRFYGFSIQEWTSVRRDDGVVGLLDIAPRPQLTIEKWDVDQHGVVLGVVQRNPTTAVDIYLPRAKLVYLCDDTLNDSPEGLGLFRHMAPLGRKLQELELLESWGFESDLRGMPVLRAPLAVLDRLVQEKQITAAKAEELIAPLKEFLRKHRKNPQLGLLLDSNIYRSEGEQRQPSAVNMWQVDVVRHEGGPQKEIDQTIERKVREMAMLMGIEHLLLGSSDRGSYALSADKSTNFGVIIDSVLLELREQFKKDILTPLWAMNGWDPALMPILKTESMQYRDIQAVVGVLEGLAKAGAPLMPNDPAINELRAQAGLSEAPEVDLSLVGEMPEEEEDQ